MSRPITRWRATYGRDIKVWTLVNIVQGETEKEARDFYNDYVHKRGDWDAAKNMVEIFSLETNKRNVPPERIKPLQEAFIQGWGGLPVVGTREQVVDTLATLSKAGLDGLLVAFPRYEEGLRDFRDKTYPLLQAGGAAGFCVISAVIPGRARRREPGIHNLCCRESWIPARRFARPGMT